MGPFLEGAAPTCLCHTYRRAGHLCDVSPLTQRKSRAPPSAGRRLSTGSWTKMPCSCSLEGKGMKVSVLQRGRPHVLCLSLRTPPCLRSRCTRVMCRAAPLGCGRHQDRIAPLLGDLGPALTLSLTCLTATMKTTGGGRTESFVCHLRHWHGKGGVQIQ